MITLAIGNQKGGVGKTTTATTLSAFYAARGLRVLLVDFDVQGHAARCLGKPKGDGLYGLLVNEEPLKRVVIEARPGLDLITSSKRTEKIRIHLSDVLSRELYIAHVLSQAEGVYDLVILDLAPGSDILHVGALVASDWIVIPCEPDYMALDGMVEILRTVRSLAQIPTVAPPQLVGILPTKFERVTNETAERLEQMKQLAGVDQILPPIPADTRVREASSRGLTIFEYAPDSRAAIGYPNGSTRAKTVNSRGNLGGYLHLAEILDVMLW